MMRWSTFVVLAAALAVYSYWIYLRVDLSVQGSRRLAAVRAIALVVLLALLFDSRLPTFLDADRATRWALLDTSLSMGAEGAQGVAPWVEASARARELEADGWTVVTFGADPPTTLWGTDTTPDELGSLLAPALERAAEAGARSVIVLSDLRFEDGVSVRAALEALPLDVRFEAFGDSATNAGISRLEVPDFLQESDSVSAEIEVHGGRPGDTLTVDVFAEEGPVATLRVPAPLPGLRARATVQLPPPDAGDRVRFTAAVSLDGDAFPGDDRAVDYAAVGREEGGLVVVSLAPDWEPRHLLPVLREVTGLPTTGFLRVGGDRFVRAGLALDRGVTADSATVRRAVADAALSVVHGLHEDADSWGRALVDVPGRKVLMVADVGGAALVGVGASAVRPGEWYASADVPPSPIAGSLSGVALQGLPPLTDVVVADEWGGEAPLLLQLRGAGPPEAAILLTEPPSGRTAIALASGFWRWAVRDNGREPYRRLWSGVVGWLLADRTVTAAEARPTRWVVDRGQPVTWSLPADSLDARLTVRFADTVVVDTSLASGDTRASGVLPPATYTYSVVNAAGDTVGAGRFDVAEATEEMLPLPDLPPVAARATAQPGVESAPGRPLRTLPWPYLLVITLLCVEWIGRRRSGLR
jgi:hypothetical protein